MRRQWSPTLLSILLPTLSYLAIIFQRSVIAWSPLENQSSDGIDHEYSEHVAVENPSLVQPLLLRSESSELNVTLSVRSFRFRNDLLSFTTRAYCLEYTSSPKWVRDYPQTELASIGKDDDNSRAPLTNNKPRCSIPGPTIAAKPGDTVRLTLINRLDIESPELESGALMNVQHSPNHTNLHTHGLHIGPSVDDVFLSLEGGGGLHEYVYRIPSNHAPGLHWYHAHRHGSVAYQLCGGLFGAIIIDPAVPASLGSQQQQRVLAGEKKANQLINIDIDIGMQVGTDLGASADPTAKLGTGVIPAELKAMQRSLLLFSYIDLDPDSVGSNGYLTMNKKIKSTLPVDVVYYQQQSQNQRELVSDRTNYEDSSLHQPDKVEFQPKAANSRRLSGSGGFNADADSVDRGDASSTAAAASSTMGAKPAGNFIKQGWFINGQYKPSFSMQAGEWHIFDMLDTSINLILELEIRQNAVLYPVETGAPFDTAAQRNAGLADCSVRLLALDGVYLTRTRQGRFVDHLVMVPATRATVAVMCPTPGQYYLHTIGTTNADHPLGHIATSKQKFNQMLMVIQVHHPSVVMSGPPDDLSGIERPSYLRSLENDPVDPSNYWSMSVLQTKCCGEDAKAKNWLGYGSDCKIPCFNDASCYEMFGEDFTVQDLASVRAGTCSYSTFQGSVLQKQHQDMSEDIEQMNQQHAELSQGLRGFVAKTSLAAEGSDPVTPNTSQTLQSSQIRAGLGAWFRPAVGDVSELALWGSGFHPMHMHVNHFQIVGYRSPIGAEEWDKYAAPYGEIGDYRDTWPALPGVSYMRVLFSDFGGEVVVHCHVDLHEDEGMMTTFLVDDQHKNRDREPFGYARKELTSELLNRASARAAYEGGVVRNEDGLSASFNSTIDHVGTVNIEEDLSKGDSPVSAVALLLFISLIVALFLVLASYMIRCFKRQDIYNYPYQSID